MKGKRKVVKCPACGERIEISKDTERGDTVYCEECDREFKVVSLKPIKLEPLDEDEEDEDDY